MSTITKEEIHNIYLHQTGKAEGISEAGKEADFPVMFANAILLFAKLKNESKTTQDS